jgi:hypothetical protein
LRYEQEKDRIKNWDMRVKDEINDDAVNLLSNNVKDLIKSSFKSESNNDENLPSIVANSKASFMSMISPKN